jgi:PAP2 superfamily
LGQRVTSSSLPSIPVISGLLGHGPRPFGRRPSAGASTAGQRGWLKRDWLQLIAFGLYILLMTVVLLSLGVSISPDRYFFVLLLPGLLIGRARRFVLDWMPFLLLLFSYEFLRGLAGKAGPVHYLGAIRLDSLLFGTPPTVLLQQRFFHPGTVSLYDEAATLVYLLHFVLPLTFAYLLWLRDGQQFLCFTLAFLAVSYAALLTFLLFPAAPPWMASQKGLLPPVQELVGVTLAASPSHLHLPTLYQFFDANPVAAIPSLHAAYPFLVWLFGLRFFGRRALLFTPYVLAVWLSIVYLGEHYVTDIVAGALYGLVGFWLTEHVLLRVRTAVDRRQRASLGEVSA